MQIEPSQGPDGSCNHWHYYSAGELIGTLERTRNGRWTVILLDGIGPIYKTRRDAHAFLMLCAQNKRR